MRKTLIVALSSLLVLTACSGEDDDDTPPPPPNVANNADPNANTGDNTGANTGAPPGQVMVTVTANSTPPGAMVTGGGRQLGTTPLTTQVPIPAPTPGQAQTFAFNFTLAGYQPAVINASPSNNQITITAALAPVTAPEPVGGDPDGDDGDSPSGGGRELRVSGRGGGPIYDNHTTRGTASVGESCTIESLRVRLVGEHSYYGDLHITLRDPGGRSYSIARGGRQNPFRTHRVRRAAGRQARGQWTLAVADRLAQDSGILRSWNLSFVCR